MALCEGLEIIEANPAFGKDIYPWNGPVLVSDLLPPRLDPEQFFVSKADHPQQDITVVRNGEPSSIRLRTLPFPSDRRYTLLECENTTERSRQAQALARARHHDSATGLRLPAPFQRDLETLLDGLDSAQTLLVCLIRATGKNLPMDQTRETQQEAESEDIQRTMDRLLREFGQRTITGQAAGAAVAVAAPLPNEDAPLRHALRRLQRIAEDGFVHKTVTLGAATGNGTKAATLLHQAQLALDQARPNAQPTLFDPAMQNAVDRDRNLSADLPSAISTGEIETHFQPIIDPAVGRIKSFEALIRWHHPLYKNVPPPMIIALASRAGLLDALTAKVVDDAIAQAAIWPDDITFAINVTPSQLGNALVDMMREKLRANGAGAGHGAGTGSGINPARLEIEITEEALIEDFAASSRIIERLRALGLGVAMDDFGVGYTSFSNLRHLSFTKIKIDKSITDGVPNDARSCAIIRAIMYLARQLSVDVTVEGVETPDQLTFLQAFDCGVQGYVFSKPLPADMLPELARFLTPNTWQCGEPPVDQIASNAQKGAPEDRKVVGLALGKKRGSAQRRSS